MVQELKSRSKHSMSARVVPKLLYLVVIVGLLAFGGFYFKKYNDLKSSSPDKIVQSQQDKMIAEIGKLYKLPTNEKPEYATVNDKESLKKQNDFFSQAENSDVVLIYPKAQLAILYRPSTKQLVKVGPVNIQANVSVKVIGPGAERQAAVTKLVAGQVAATDGGDAKGSYSATTVVDLTGKNAEQAKKIAEALGAQVGALPAGEDKPANTDVLVVVATPGS